MKAISWLRNAPQVKCCSLISNSPAKVPPPLTRPISGVRNESTKAATTAVNAAPMTTATARSTTLPRSRKSLKPFIMGSSIHTSLGATRQAHREGGGGRRRGQPGRRGRVHGEQQQARRRIGLRRRTRCGQHERTGGDDLRSGGVRRGGQHVDPVAGAHQA